LHLGWELAISQSNRVILEGGGESRELEPGTLFAVPPGVAHSVHADEPFTFCALRLPSALVSSALADMELPEGVSLVSSSAAAEVWRWLCEQLFVAASPQVHTAAIVGALRSIGADIKASGNVVGQTPEAVSRMRNYLIENYKEKVSARDLAEKVELSQYHAARLFRRYVGMSPHEFQIVLRVEQAKRLLASGALVTEAATATGFSDQSHLHRYFRRYVHVTPGDYRRWTPGERTNVQAELSLVVGQQSSDVCDPEEE
jgi:AraC-like DNA-binding protein